MIDLGVFDAPEDVDYTANQLQEAIVKAALLTTLSLLEGPKSLNIQKSGKETLYIFQHG